jgi:hypothetical protein
MLGIVEHLIGEAGLDHLASPRSRSSNRACTETSRPPVGSSMKTRRGRVTRVRAICSRCCMPPENVVGRSSIRSVSISTRPSQSRAAARISP